MTYFANEPRDIHKHTHHHSLGPGEYLQHHQTQQKAYAPFGSLSSKKQNNNQGGIGPGQYDISREIIKPSITKYENRNIIIVKINDEGGHQFKSRTNRFQEQKAIPTVGPGSYYSAPQHKARSASFIQKPKIVETIRQINHKYLEERRQPSLLSDVTPLIQKQKQTQNQTPKSRGVMNWSLNRKQRFDLSVKQQFSLEDKQKALSEMNISRKQKIKPSAVFASKSIKSHIQTQIYKTNNAFKAELRKMIDFKDDQPGPGSYEPISSLSKLQIKTQSKFQFFGSTVERFPQKLLTLGNVGPGSYKLQTQQQKQSQRQHYQTAQKQQRHSYIPKSQHPGPGSYKVQINVNPIKSQKQYDYPFGSNQPRTLFSSKQNDNEIIDANFQINAKYKQKQQKKQDELRHRRMMSENHPYPAFVSGSKRFQTDPISQLQIGCYDITQNDINARIQKYQKLAKQLQECQLHKPPFMSSNQRFKNDKTEVCTHKDCWCLVKSVEKQIIQHESPSFISNEKRTAVFSGSNKAPPVGHYSTNEKSFIKDSFNSRFRKKNQNQKKKSQVIKNKNSYQDRLKTQPVQLGAIG